MGWSFGHEGPYGKFLYGKWGTDRGRKDKFINFFPMFRYQ